MKFYDTSSLLLLKNIDEKIAISSITWKELENIKTSFNKDYATKSAARRTLFMLDNNSDKVEVILFRNSFLKPIEEADFLINDDAKILACALAVLEENDIFVSNDRGLRKTAEVFFPNVEKVELKPDDYTGYKEVCLSESEMADLYQNMDKNYFDLKTNQYLNIYDDLNNDLVDTLKWNGEKLVSLQFTTCESKMFGKIKPKDAYQKMALDAMKYNKLTVLRGKAGSGKSLLALGYLFQLLENGKIDKIIMFVNPVATRDSCKFGFLPGELIEKILGSQIGNFLSSKLGGIDAVYQLIDSRQLEFITLADARGYDTSGMNCGIYMTESQNTTIDTMKLILSRIGEDSICILDGDNDTQVDMASYENERNGLARVCEVYKGEPYFGTVKLNKCYRSRIAEKSDEM